MGSAETFVVIESQFKACLSPVLLSLLLGRYALSNKIPAGKSTSEYVSWEKYLESWYQKWSVETESKMGV